jgi:hypothetical protein
MHGAPEATGAVAEPSTSQNPGVATNGVITRKANAAVQYPLRAARPNGSGWDIQSAARGASKPLGSLQITASQDGVHISNVKVASERRLHVPRQAKMNTPTTVPLRPKNGSLQRAMSRMATGSTVQRVAGSVRIPANTLTLYRSISAVAARNMIIYGPSTSVSNRWEGGGELGPGFYGATTRDGAEQWLQDTAGKVIIEFTNARELLGDAINPPTGWNWSGGEGQNHLTQNDFLVSSAHRDPTEYKINHCAYGAIRITAVHELVGRQWNRYTLDQYKTRRGIQTWGDFALGGFIHYANPWGYIWNTK